jgi:lipopolysaccharide transport system ATP-binding protein
MSDSIIEIENLGKLYRLGMIGRTSIRDSFERLWERLNAAKAAPQQPAAFFKGRGLRGDQMGTAPNTFWALRDLSLNVQRGEVLGIIGRNGAGKSTLLKILSRITEPTTGQAVLKGRVASLLEVGTGFHPELSGRDNIFLNGALLGMKKNEIVRKFDEIVEFAEVSGFIDTPVKRYSSGMYVRLAFAVAAHLEPEILIVDEVLAVGDLNFQKKCIGKMGDVAKHGRTVLVVSHNMASVLSLCQRAVLLDGGRIINSGGVEEVVNAYFKASKQEETIPLHARIDRDGDGSTRFTALKIESTDPDGVIRSSSRLKLTIDYSGAQPLRFSQFNATIYNANNTGIFALNSDAAGGLPEELPSEGTVICTTSPINLTPGTCQVNLTLMKGGGTCDYIQGAATFEIESDNFYGTGRMPSRDWVIGLLKNEWSVSEPRRS